VEFTLGSLPAGGSEVVLDVVTNGGRKTVWQEHPGLLGQSAIVRGRFRVASSDRAPFETRVLTQRAPLTVEGVVPPVALLTGRLGTRWPGCRDWI
jgi:hypothetical protein